MANSVTAAPDRFIPDVFQGEIEPNFFCRHWNPRRQKYCGARAGYRTDHPGVGRCKWGGGKSPVKHGRYSGIVSESIRNLAKNYEADPDPLNLTGELALARALRDDFINRHEQPSGPFPDELVEALERVIEEYTVVLTESEDPSQEKKADLERARRCLDIVRAMAKSPQTMDLSEAITQVEIISRIVKRIEDIRSQDAISRPELIRLVAEMGRNANYRIERLGRRLLELVPGEKSAHLAELLEEAKESIAEDWNRIQL